LAVQPWARGLVNQARWNMDELRMVDGLRPVAGALLSGPFKQARTYDPS